MSKRVRDEASEAETAAFLFKDAAFSSPLCWGGSQTAYRLSLRVLACHGYPPGTQNFAQIISEFEDRNLDIIMGLGHSMV